MGDREGYCKRCKYSLRGLPSGACPECGKPFSWQYPASYKSDEGSPDPAEYVQEEYRRSVKTRRFVFGGLLAAGLVPILFVDWWASYACCVLVLLYPAWLVGCVVGLLAVLSPTGSLDIPWALLIGLIAGTLLGGGIALTATSIGLLGFVAGPPAGLMGGLVFKQFELNNML